MGVLRVRPGRHSSRSVLLGALKGEPSKPPGCRNSAASALREKQKSGAEAHLLDYPCVAAGDEVARRMRVATKPLADAGKRGAFLLQLTPGFSPRRNQLSDLDPILDELDPVAVEFRHRGWVEGEHRQEVLDYLRERGAIFVGVDAPRAEHFTILPPLDSVTNPRLAYLRCHGRNLDGYLRGRTVAERFDYEYPEGEVEEIAERARVLADEAEQVHVMFNNNARDYAPKAARRMLLALGEASG
jgi:uncharacterized protein YecE (DUF72 family)